MPFREFPMRQHAGRKSRSPLHLHPSHAALRRPCSQHSAKKPFTRLPLSVHVTQLSPETICLSQPFSSIPGGLIHQRQPLRKATCAPCRNSSLSSAWAIRACCSGSHKRSLNGRRHTWQRDDCLYAVFPLS